MSNNFAATMRAWRQGKYLSQREAAEALSVPLRTYQNWEQGVCIPRSVVLCSLATYIPNIQTLISHGIHQDQRETLPQQ